MHGIGIRPGRALLTCLTLAAAIASSAAHADVESDLRARLIGRSAIILGSVTSECSDHFTDNLVSGRYASGKGPVRLPEGELATVENVHIGFTRFDVNLTLATPYRLSIVDGPFELFELRRCRVQLSFDVPRAVRRDLASAEATVLNILELHGSVDAARSSQSWNGRQTEPLPADNDARWAEYRLWKAAQMNVEIRRKLDRVLEEADRAMSSMKDDPDYLDSFARGVASRRWESFSSCESALTATFYTTGSGGKSSSAYADGQRMAWALALARYLQDCWIDTP